MILDFWLIVVTEGNEDETEILPYANTSNCPKGADVRQLGARASSPMPVAINGSKPYVHPAARLPVALEAWIDVGHGVYLLSRQPRFRAFGRAGRQKHD